MICRNFARPNHEQGFSLIELMVAITILSSVLLVLAGFINSGAILSKQNEEENVAIGLAQEKIEEVKGYFPSSPAAFTSSIAPHTDLVSSMNNVNYTRTLEVEPVMVTPDTWTGPTGEVYSNKYLIRVTVTVSWDSKAYTRTKSRSVGMLTYVAGR